MPMVVRKIGRALAALLVCSLVAPQAYALGLGEIELESHLNEKFKGRIELYDAEGLQSAEIIVSLASREDFDRVGVERFFFLTGLRFSVEFVGGKPEIRINSAQPISEPYLNFLVEVLWPQGRLLKEYTVLLDPPTYTATVSAPEQAPRTAVAEQPPRSSAPAPRQAEPTSRGTQVALAPAARTAASGGANMTGRNDTLWSIANRNRPSNQVSVNQYMLAIQRANPQAFINGNINLMKAGYVLRMPEQSEALDLTAAQANVEVARQTDVWRGIARPSAREQFADSSPPSLRQQVDATPSAPPPTSGDPASSGTLQIVAGEGDVAQGSTGEGIADAQTLEENERLSREVDELTYQMDREREQATDQIAVRDRRLEVQDQQLAALRQELERAQAQLDSLRNNPQSQNQNRPADTSTPFWASPTFMLIAGAAVLVLALIGGLLFMRKRQAANAAQAYGERTAPTDNFAIGDVADTPAAEHEFAEADAFAERDRDQDDDDDPLDLLQDLDDEQDVPDAAFAGLDDVQEEAATAPPSLQTSDVIGEADIYAAYGRYPHAIGLLTGALEEDANRHDVRLKLLEVCVAAEDVDTFDTHLSELLDRCSDQDILLAARELEESMPERAPREGAMDASASAALAAGFVAAGGASRATAEEDEYDLDDELLADDLLSVEGADNDDDDLLDLDDLEAEVEDLLAAGDTSDDSAGDGIPELDDFEGAEDLLDSELQALAGAEDTGSAESFDLQFEDDAVASLKTSDSTDDDGFALSDDELSVGDNGDDYETLGSVALEDDDDLEGSLGGDLGLDFDPDAHDDTGSSSATPALGLGDDDLEIEDLLAELDADADLLGEENDALGSAVFDDEADVLDEEDGGAEILSFSRPDDDVSMEALETSAGSLGGAVTDDFDDDVFADDADAADTKLDLAQAYIDMGDEDGARDILGEVLQEGTDAQRNTAQNLLDGLAS